MNTHLLHHPSLGPIEGTPIDTNLVQFRGIPYASIPQRFSRSKLLTGRLTPTDHALPFDATKPGPASIQPLGSAETDAEGNQLPSEGLEDEPQSEDCLDVTITVPKSALPGSGAKASELQKLPAVVFLHGGAFFIGAGTRGYYTPYTFMRTAIAQQTPLILISANYRLGALGFFHSPQVDHLIPPNNGLHDQLLALEFIQQNISGFGGDAGNVTLVGQSAGGESTVLHNKSGLGRGLYKRSIAFSGSSVTMPAKTPEEHQENFLSQAGELGIETHGRTSEDVAKDIIDAPVEKIRDLGWVGAPCSQTPAMPEDRPSMRINREGTAGKQGEMGEWLESQVVSACGYDGSISFIMTRNDEERNHHAAAIRKIAFDVLGEEKGQELLDIYDIKDEGVESEDVALKRICQFESDAGFFAGALSVVVGSTCGSTTAKDKDAKRTKTYFQIFDIGNPFDGPLEQGRYASHTWDIVALLGAYDDKVKRIEEERGDDKYRPYTTLVEWRKRLIQYMVDGKAPWKEWESVAMGKDEVRGVSGISRQGGGQSEKKEGIAMVVKNDGMKEWSQEEYLGENGSRRRRLLELAETHAGADGWDVMWTDVCRRFLMAGK